MAQQSHSSYVAQDNFSDIYEPPRSSLRLCTLVGDACAARTTGVTDDEANIAAEAAHDRRHELPQHVAEHAESLHLRHSKLQCFPQTTAGQARHRGCPRVPAAPDGPRP